MTTPVVMPKQGNSVESCLIMAWKKQVGEPVAIGDVLLLIETDKATVEVESPAEGTLIAQFFAVGDDVPVMTNVGVIGETGDDVELFRPETTSSAAATPTNTSSKSPAPSPATPQSTATQRNGGDVFISPRAQVLADKHNIPLNALTPTGPEGRIIERDVQAVIATRPRMTRAAAAQAPPTTLPTVGTGIGGRVTSADLTAAQQAQAPVPIGESQTDDVTQVPMRGIRQRIAERMTASLQEMAQLTLNASADARAILAYRKRLKASAEGLGLQKVSVNDLLMFVVSRVLLNYPELNATLENDTISQWGVVHLGFAVDTPRGLVVPTVRDAHTLSLRALSTETKRLVTNVQDGKISPDELTGGTFTVSNLGALGIESFTPVINPPQVAILGVGKTDLKPVLVDDEVQFIPHMYLSLTIDHRAIDGAPAARFLSALADAIAEVDLWLAM